jgi:alkylated DNA repair dioxygenase AlkB
MAKLFNMKKEELKLPNARLSYFPDFLSEYEASELFDIIKDQTNWRQDEVVVFGKTYQQPRLTALYSSSNKSYSYSGLTMHPEPFPEYLWPLKNRLESTSHIAFNTLLMNLYRDGQDSNGWHADNEKELGINPVIASISLGEERPFHFKHRSLKEERHKLILEHGSLLLMLGEMQHHWLHQIAKTKRNIGPRINLTFRNLVH